MSLPLEFISQMKNQLGSEAEAFFCAMQAPYERGIRMNPIKSAPKPAGIQECIPWAKDAFYLAADSDAGADILHEAGAYYIQEPSAMAPAEVLNAEPDDAVLDLCAAPGGKSTQIAARIENGVLVSNEINLKRAQILSSNIERMGIRHAVVTSASPQELAQKWPQYFDKILVDAPCSGEGMFRRHPETANEWSAASPEGCAQRQKEILDCAARMLKPGGRLVYSTCTFNNREDDGQIQDFLITHPDFETEPFSMPGLEQAKNGMLHIWPHRTRGEGHFIASLRKKNGDYRSLSPMIFPLPTKEDMETTVDFLKNNVMTSEKPNALFMGRTVMAPEKTPPLHGIKVIRAGLHLGERRGRLFIPDHALAMALPCMRTVQLSMESALSYLHGDALPAPTDFRGWCALTYQGLQLGWGKASDGQIKNHYPKGLRK